MTPDRLEEMAREIGHVKSKHSETCWRCDIAWPCPTVLMLAQARREGAEAERARAERIFREWHEYIWPRAPRDAFDQDFAEFARRLKASE